MDRVPVTHVGLTSDDEPIRSRTAEVQRGSAAILEGGVMRNDARLIEGLTVPRRIEVRNARNRLRKLSGMATDRGHLPGEANRMAPKVIRQRDANQNRDRPIAPMVLPHGLPARAANGLALAAAPPGLAVTIQEVPVPTSAALGRPDRPVNAESMIEVAEAPAPERHLEVNATKARAAAPGRRMAEGSKDAHLEKIVAADLSEMMMMSATTTTTMIDRRL